ncbi:unnamed protein product [Brachionus calyciflorus]|uniref:Uncharacterized protein n=1 Tax=Brachionus calyciflorus TaxID=104777 RepID=A0A814DGL8_9BILA|nr:unnamed protein product [Brachionus calyciflorus]
MNIEVDNRKNRICIRRNTAEKYNQDCIIKRTKQGSGSIGIWCCMNTVIKRVRDEYGSMSSILRDEINKILAEDYDVDELAAKMPKYENKRNQDMPTFQKSLSNIDLSIQRYKETTYNKRFLLFDTNDKDRIIAFSSDILLNI